MENQNQLRKKGKSKTRNGKNQKIGKRENGKGEKGRANPTEKRWKKQNQKGKENQKNGAGKMEKQNKLIKNGKVKPHGETNGKY